MQGAVAFDQGSDAILIDGRYRIEKMLGQGGLAVVHQVHDLQTGSTKALKQLCPREDAQLQQRNVELFEREFHTLVQLAHPRTIAVHDYGFHEGNPYYTMELLDGGDLFERAPVEWRQACSLARDVCSALSLLHSRRLVYRDLSPRNVRCTSDGQAKLIDFGAVAPMGPSKQIVGTASFCAPEVVDSQALEARTDLYSLGATLYYTLTARRPYPARDFRHIREAWRRLPNRPSHWVPGIPHALDELVMALLQLDVMLRPGSAAEVMERLNGIAELAIDEHLLVSLAYLSTPMLIGRDAQLARVREKIMRATQGRGSAVMIRSAPGLGRSRLLDACALQAQLAGASVLRGDAEDAQNGDYGVVRALCAQLLDKLPEVARAAAQPLLGTLGHVLPELLQKEPGATLTAFEDPAQLRPNVQSALRQWAEAVARHKPLMIAVDDVHAIDEPSAAFIALLARAVSPHALLIIVTSDADHAGSGHTLALLSEASTPLELNRLSAEETRLLLASVFGEVPNLALIADRLHAISAGNPRDVMRLAQHLVDKRVVRYQAGTWALPERIDTNDLPSSIAQSLMDGVSLLNADTRSLAQALALSPEQHFTYEECLALSGHCPAGRLVQMLDELVTADVVKRSAERCGIARQGWVPALLGRTDPEQQRRLQLRLAEVFEMRGDLVRMARHLFHAGDEPRAVDVLVQHAHTSQEQTDPSSEAFAKLIESLPADWIECYGAALRACEREHRPRRDGFVLRSRMAGILSVTGSEDTIHLSDLLEQLERASGLDLYASLDAGMEPVARLQRTFELAQKRYEGSNAEERILDPLTATRQLARALIQLSAIAVTTRNLSFLVTFPSLEPYFALSPALVVVQRLVEAARYRCTGRNERVRKSYRAILERTSQPDRAGLDESHHRHGTFGVKFGLGILEAAMGFESSLSLAAEIEPNPLYQVNAWTIRMLYHLWQGQTREADRCKSKVDVLRVQNCQRQFFEGTHIPTELAAHVAAGDLMRVKQSIGPIDELAKQYAGWRPILHYAVGEYHRLRGDNPTARKELEAALEGPVGNHQVWADAVGGYIKTLVELGCADQAVARGTEYLSAVREQDLGCETHLIRIPLAMAQAKAGAYAEAVAQAESTIDELKALGATGLTMAMAYRGRARIARTASDLEAMRHYATLGVQVFQSGVNPRILARYSSLLKERPTHSAASDAVFGISTVSLGNRSAVLTSIERCQDSKERAHCSLELLIRSSGTTEGFLYAIQDGDPVLVAQIGLRELPREVDAVARELLVNCLEEQDKTKVTSPDDGNESDEESGSSWVGLQGERYRPVLLQHSQDGALAVTGLAIFVVERDKGFVYPGQVAAELSKAVADFGDVIPLLPYAPTTNG